MDPDGEQEGFLDVVHAPHRLRGRFGRRDGPHHLHRLPTSPMLRGRDQQRVDRHACHLLLRRPAVQVAAQTRRRGGTPGDPGAVAHDDLRPLVGAELGPPPPAPAPRPGCGTGSAAPPADPRWTRSGARSPGTHLRGQHPRQRRREPVRRRSLRHTLEPLTSLRRLPLQASLHHPPARMIRALRQARRPNHNLPERPPTSPPGTQVAVSTQGDT